MVENPALTDSARIALLDQAACYLQAERFAYGNSEARRQGCDLLLDAWQFLLNWVECLSEDSAALLYDMLTALVRRCEWLVSELAFDDKTFRPTAPKWAVAQAVRSRDLLCGTLSLALSKAEYLDMCTPAVQSFCARMAVVGFFCLPDFCGVVLDAISMDVMANLDPHLAGVLAVLSDNDRQLARTIAAALDSGPAVPGNLLCASWLFRGLPPSMRSSAILVTCLQSDLALVRELGRRQAFFYMFVKEYVVHVRYVYRVSSPGASTGAGGAVIPFCVLPGYTAMLAITLDDMRLAPSLADQAAAFVDATRYLLLNPYVLSPFLDLLFMRTSVHARESVLLALDRATLWFRVFIRHHSVATITNTFDPATCLAAIDIIFRESEHFALLCRTIKFVYDVSGAFFEAARQTLIADIMLKRCTFAAPLRCAAPCRAGPCLAAVRRAAPCRPVPCRVAQCRAF